MITNMPEMHAAKARAFDLLRADYEAAKAGRISCGHTVADLIGGIEKGPGGIKRPSVTKCGACLLARQGEPRRADLVREMIDRLTREAESFRQLRHVSVSDARIRADACCLHSRALATLLSDARDLADAGHHDRAIALLRGDMPAPKDTP